MTDHDEDQDTPMDSLIASLFAPFTDLASAAVAALRDHGGTIRIELLDDDGQPTAADTIDTAELADLLNNLLAFSSGHNHTA